MSILNFNDSRYADLARAAEAKYGLPSGLLDAVRTRGERSNANQVSEAGARSVYQFIPSTRQGFIKNYGIDPWSSPESATEAAALHLRDDHTLTGSWDDAIVRYHGGSNPRNWGPRTTAYARRVGSFDGRPLSAPEAASNSESSVPYVDPLAPLPDNVPMDTAPTPGPGMSVPQPAASVPPTRKHRGGILGALENVFMPQADSLWAGALRNGLVNAHASQDAYKQQQAQAALEQQSNELKLQQLKTKGQYQIVGNNVFHIKPDGSTEMISAPDKIPDKQAMFNQWRSMPPGPERDTLRTLMLGSVDPSVLAEQTQRAATVAGIRAGATTSAARIRAAAPSRSSAAPKYEYKMVNGELMRRRVN